MKEAEAAAERIIVEVRLSDEALARRVSNWLEESASFIWGTANGPGAVIIADHVPDDVSAPVILIAAADIDQPRWHEPRVMARLDRRSIDMKKLRIAIEAAASGMSVEDLSDKWNRDPISPSLTGREKAVLQLLAEGASNKVIARRLGISVHTVKFHVAAILDKLGAKSRTEAVMQGLRFGVLMV